MKYKCLVCGYIYDPAENDNVQFADLAEDDKAAEMILEFCEDITKLVGE